MNRPFHILVNINSLVCVPPIYCFDGVSELNPRIKGREDSQLLKQMPKFQHQMVERSGVQVLPISSPLLIYIVKTIKPNNIEADV